MEVGDVEGDDNTMDAILVPEIEWLRRRLGRTSAFELIIRLLYFSSKKMKSSGIPKREDKVVGKLRKPAEMLIATNSQNVDPYLKQ